MRTQFAIAAAGGSISINAHEEALARSRECQRDPRWRDDYRATRPKRLSPMTRTRVLKG